MLIDFSFENYLSFRDKATFSFVVPGGIKKDLDRYVLGVEDERYLLSTFAALYGPNASGKSNVIRAMSDFVNLILYSHNLGIDAPIPSYRPYKLDVAAQSAPVNFEAEFVAEKVRYQFGVKFDRKAILEEELAFFPAGRRALLYSRKKGEPIIFGNSFRGPKKGLEQYVRDNALFLSTAVNLSNEQLKPIYRYFQRKYRFHVSMDSHGNPIMRTTNNLLRGDTASKEAYKKEVLNFLNAADISVVDVSIKKNDQAAKSINLPADLPQEVRDTVIEGVTSRPSLGHPLYSGNAPVGENEFFDLYEEESGGTVKMYELAGEIIDMLKSGGVLLVDEFNSGLHPQLCEYIISLFHDREINKNGAQLIVTDHDTNLMRRDDVYRDELWLVDRDKYGASEIYSINDFSKDEIRKGTNLEKWYLDGRFKAVPSIDPSIFKPEDVHA
ncbi:MAG: ATP-binding protein [Rectinema sp.]